MCFSFMYIRQIIIFLAWQYYWNITIYIVYSVYHHLEIQTLLCTNPNLNSIKIEVDNLYFMFVYKYLKNIKFIKDILGSCQPMKWFDISPLHTKTNSFLLIQYPTTRHRKKDSTNLWHRVVEFIHNGVESYVNLLNLFFIMFVTATRWATDDPLQSMVCVLCVFACLLNCEYIKRSTRRGYLQLCTWMVTLNVYIYIYLVGWRFGSNLIRCDELAHWWARRQNGARDELSVCI